MTGEQGLAIKFTPTPYLYSILPTVESLGIDHGT
jgi:hypothetical protein